MELFEVRRKIAPCVKESEIMAVVRHKAKKIRRKQTKRGAGKSVAGSPQSGMAADLRQRLGLKQMVFARLLPMSVRALASLESGSPPSDVAARRLIELRRMVDALSEIMREESIGSWLQTPNEAFDGLKPLEVIERGESDRIWSMIYYLRSGVTS